MDDRQLIYKDVLHGEIELPTIIKAIIETTEFRRLKKIKQLGFVYKLYGEATHTRYEHCLGTYISATKFMECLERNTQNLKIPQNLKNCVAIAGLLHDIGHGPFSHIWESVSGFNHEYNSFECIDALFEKLPEVLSKSYKIHNYQNKIIKAFITGDKKILSKPLGKFEFLFEIVHNKQCGIDVDKWDYLKRDAHYTRAHLKQDVNLNLDFDDVFTGARVSTDGAHIEYKAEHFKNIFNLFNARQRFHMEIYQHPTVKVLEILFMKVMRRVDERNIRFKEFNDKLISKISSRDSEEFTNLTDENIYKVLRSVPDKDISRLMDCFDQLAFKEDIPIENSESEIICVDVEIARVGEILQNAQINYYGSFVNKSDVNLEKGFYKKRLFYRLCLP